MEKKQIKIDVTQEAAQASKVAAALASMTRHDWASAVLIEAAEKQGVKIAQTSNK